MGKLARVTKCASSILRLVENQEMNRKVLLTPSLRSHPWSGPAHTGCVSQQLIKDSVQITQQKCCNFLWKHLSRKHMQRYPVNEPHPGLTNLPSCNAMFSLLRCACGRRERSSTMRNGCETRAAVTRCLSTLQALLTRTGINSCSCQTCSGQSSPRTHHPRRTLKEGVHWQVRRSQSVLSADSDALLTTQHHSMHCSINSPKSCNIRASKGNSRWESNNY